MPLVRGEGVRVVYGQIAAVYNVSLEVEAGEVVALVRPNGAGKTTLFNTIGGLLRPTAGRIEVRKRDVSRLAVDRGDRRGIDRTFQTPLLIARLSAYDNIMPGSQARTLNSLFAAVLRLP